jgi:hypothetical protein
MATKVFGNFTHKWELDLPWHMVDLKDWFYMVDVGFIEPVMFLHVRVFGLRSLWECRISPNLQRSPTPRAPVQSEQDQTVDKRDGPVYLKRVHGSHFVEIPKPSDPKRSDGG